MQIVIDIPEENYENKTLVDYFGCYSKMLDATIYNGTPIPDNATNGEVMKIMFMPNQITRTDDVVREEYEFNEVWWNAPYQKGGKE